jgi:hypothetical protein
MREKEGGAVLFCTWSSLCTHCTTMCNKLQAHDRPEVKHVPQNYWFSPLCSCRFFFCSSLSIVIIILESHHLHTQDEDVHELHPILKKQLTLDDKCWKTEEFTIIRQCDLCSGTITIRIVLYNFQPYVMITQKAFFNFQAIYYWKNYFFFVFCIKTSRLPFILTGDAPGSTTTKAEQLWQFREASFKCPRNNSIKWHKK